MKILGDIDRWKKALEREIEEHNAKISAMQELKKKEMEQKQKELNDFKQLKNPNEMKNLLNKFKTNAEKTKEDIDQKLKKDTEEFN